MAALSDFLQYVLPSAPGCSDPLAERVIRDVCIDFCSKTLIDQRTLDPMPAIANVNDYEFDLMQDVEVAMIMQAWFKERKLAVINADSPSLRPEAFNSYFTGAGKLAGSVNSIIQKDKTGFTLEAAPSENSPQAITIRAAVRPTRTAETVADILFADYAFEIGQGALARLLRMPQQPFTDQQTAVICERDYTIGRNAAMLRARMSMGRSETRVDLGRAM